MKYRTCAIIALGMIGVSPSSATVITGQLLTNPNNPARNLFDPNFTSGFSDTVAHPEYGNVKSGSDVVSISGGIEFGYEESASDIADTIYTADFTDNTLTIKDVTTPFTSNVVTLPLFFIFTSDTPGFFDNLVDVSDSLHGNYTVSGDQLTINTPSVTGTVNRALTLSFTPASVTAAVPEPSSWALFIGGFGVVGGSLRRRRAVVRFG